MTTGVAGTKAWWPCNDADRIRSRKMTTNIKEIEPSEHPRILLVDDNEMVRTSLTAVLEVNKFHVTTAANVAEALHLIDIEPFDVLLCDLHMPGPGDGFTVVSAMG